MGREKTQEGGERRGRMLGTKVGLGLNGRELGAIHSSAELGAKIYDAELGARVNGAEPSCRSSTVFRSSAPALMAPSPLAVSKFFPPGVYL